VQSKLQIITKSTTTKTILATIAVSALIGSAIIFPSLPYAISKFTKLNTKKEKYYLKKVFKKLERQNLISISETSDGKVKITLTENGRARILDHKIDAITIKKADNWDKIWRLVIFDIPETKKVNRDIFRQKLKNLGFYPLQKSIFAIPYHCKDEIDFLKHNFGIADHVTYIEAKYIDKQNHLRNYFQI